MSQPGTQSNVYYVCFGLAMGCSLVLELRDGELRVRRAVSFYCLSGIALLFTTFGYHSCGKYQSTLRL